MLMVFINYVVCLGLRYSILLSRRRNAHEVLVQVATCNNAAAEPQAELGTFCRLKVLRKYLFRVPNSRQSQITRANTKLSLVISMKRGQGRGKSRRNREQGVGSRCREKSRLNVACRHSHETSSFAGDLRMRLPVQFR